MDRDMRDGYRSERWIEIGEMKTEEIDRDRRDG